MHTKRHIANRAFLTMIGGIGVFVAGAHLAVDNYRQTTREIAPSGIVTLPGGRDSCQASGGQDIFPELKTDWAYMIEADRQRHLFTLMRDGHIAVTSGLLRQTANAIPAGQELSLVSDGVNVFVWSRDGETMVIQFNCSNMAARK